MVKQKAFFIIFERLSVARNCLGPNSGRLKLNCLLFFFEHKLEETKGQTEK